RPTNLISHMPGVLASPTTNGAALYVEGGRAWEIEAGINALAPAWMGAKQHAELMRGQEVLGDGESWTGC
ncbi:hypothetical protein B0A49_11346, partial [Cryomyces minteri]